MIKKHLRVFLFAIFFAMTISSFGLRAVAADSKGAISKVSNVSSGIKISWTVDSAKTGYYIYKKVGSGKWEKVKTISDKTVASWTDQDTSQGKKYSYKVSSYKKSTEYKNDLLKVIYRLKTPTVKSFKQTAKGAFYMETNSSKSVDGYQLVYSQNSDFSSKTTKTFSDVHVLKETIKGLSSGKTYYVKVRAYKLVSGKKYYSAYTAVKSLKLKSYLTRYVLRSHLTLYEEANSASKSIRVKYMDKLGYYGVEVAGKSGTWYKLRYNNKVYYAWEVKGETVLTEKKSSFSYTDDNIYRQAVIDKALYILKNWETKYVHDQSDGIADTDGKYGFDCSGFASYLLGSVMQKDVPAYRLTKNIMGLYETKTILNEGYSNPFYAKDICVGRPDSDKLLPGDVLFFKVDNESTRDKECNHCAVYLGNNEFIHSTSGFDGVCIMPLTGMYADCFLKAVRFLPEEVPPTADDTLYILQTCTVYEEVTCENPNGDKLKKGSSVRLLYTSASNDRAYVEYDLSSGSKGKGFIWLKNTSATAP